MSVALEAVFGRFPDLHTERLHLRQSRLTDANAVFAVLSQESVTRHYNLSPLTSIDEARALIERRAASYVSQERIRWAIALREDDLVIGSCGYVHWNRDDARAEIGYGFPRTGRAGD